MDPKELLYQFRMRIIQAKIDQQDKVVMPIELRPRSLSFVWGWRNNLNQEVA